jgi:virginiamycin A acetyltransferase
MSGVTIGDGAVVGAYSIVTKDVPPYMIVAGNPAKQIRKRFSDEIINKLLELKWWDMDESRINEISDILCSNDLEKLNNI